MRLKLNVAVSSLKYSKTLQMEGPLRTIIRQEKLTVFNNKKNQISYQP